ncbi:MAG: ATP-binding protein [Geminicoccaceae bacterium]
MGLNPFSRGVGRRRAAMTGEHTPNDAARADETDHLPNDAAQWQDDALNQADSAKGFGFAYRSEQDQSDEAPELALEAPLADDAVHPGDTNNGAAPQPIHAQQPPTRTTAKTTTERRPVTRPSPPEQPVVSTPHIDALRAEIGIDAGDSAESWASDEPEAPPAPSRPAARPAPPPSQAGEVSTSVQTPQAPDAEMAMEDEVVFLDGDESADEAPQYGPDDEESYDPINDVAVTIGRIVSIRGSVIWGALFDDIDGQAARAARMGALVSMRGPESRVFGIVNALEREQQGASAGSERTLFEIQVLGEIADDRTGFQRGVSSYPPLDSPVTTITIRDIATIYARPRSSNVHIGQLRHNPKVPSFVLTDSLLGKHFAVLGTTGTGKSCATTVILRSILDEHQQGHIVLIDPHNEYGAAFADRAELLNPSNLNLPYWLLNFEEIAHIILGSGARDLMDAQSTLLKNAIIEAKSHSAAVAQVTADTPVPYRLSDLVKALKDGMGDFNKTEGASLYMDLINRIESLSVDQRYAFMFSSISVRDNMEQILAQLLRIPTNGKPMTIIDISGLPSEVVDVVVSVLFRLTFELAVWSERGKAPPVLLVCEEAHRYVPEESDGGFAPTKRVIAQIAKEGRKYGVTLCLVSQRPSELAVSSLAQCNTIFALRMSNEHDQAFVSQTLSENARWLVDSLPSLNTQEAVVVGDGVTVPVHIRFKDLAPEHRPASNDPSFAKSWCREADGSFLEMAIDRWRRQAR